MCALPTSTARQLEAFDCNDTNAASHDTLLLVLVALFVMATVASLVGVHRLTRPGSVQRAAARRTPRPTLSDAATGTRQDQT